MGSKSLILTKTILLESALALLFFFISFLSCGQEAKDSVKKESDISRADDPTNFITRTEVYNELQRYDKTDVYLDQTIFRVIIKVGKKFSTRIDLPIVYNSTVTAAKDKQSGLGDISLRLLGFKIFEDPLSAITISLEASLNTAESKLLGTGKNILVPAASYTRAYKKQGMFFSMIFQQVNSVSGDENRATLSYSKLQAIFLKTLSKKTWVVFAPEWYLDYVKGGLSMNFRTRFTHAPKPRLNFWITPSVGVFGDFVGRYTWDIDAGFRYFLIRENKKKK